jgi:hypothetical protein
MGLRTRSFRCAILVLLGLAIAALPGTWPGQVPGSTFGPTLTWAGGTPDETLNPPPTPPQSGTNPKKGTSYATGGPTAADRLSQASLDDRGRTWRTIWQVLRAAILRI